MDIHLLKTQEENSLIFLEAVRIAEASHCTTIMIFGDVMISSPIILDEVFRKYKTILVTRRDVATMDEEEKSCFTHIISVASLASRRFAQWRSAAIVGLTHEIFSPDEKICRISGLVSSNRFDTLSIVELMNEFNFAIPLQKDFLPGDVRPEVFERVLSISSDIAVEGREGKPIGSLIILGSMERIRPYVRPLVLNPFQGHAEQDRHILNPFMAEIIKEFSSIDGAFVVRGDGVIEAAGMMIQAPHNERISLPPGLGTRHMAAANISAIADCIAVAVSQSTRHVTLFHHGEMLALSERSFLKAEI
jgi:DNA integrity scanning protein DisA with diadenylate cyclase activity